jgi:hypothetical protein
MLDIERKFLGTQRGQGAFQRRDIQRRLAAETLIEHPGICPRLFDNARKYSIIPATVNSGHDGCVNGVAYQSAQQLVMRAINRMHVRIGEAAMMLRRVACILPAVRDA